MEELQTTNKGYYNENTKKAMYKWRNNHRDQWNEYRRQLSLKYYYQNAENVEKKNARNIKMQKSLGRFAHIIMNYLLLLLIHLK